MRYDLSRFKSGTDRIDRTYEPSAFADVLRGDRDFSVVAPVHLQADVTKTGPKVSLTGRLTTTLELPCSRCLEGYRLPLDATLDLLFVPAQPAPAGSDAAAAVAKGPRRADRRDAPGGPGAEDEDAGHELGDEDVNVSSYSNDEIDLGQMMREQFYLALPMKPLCAPDCKGLCPVCGANRNRETCSCESTWVDPRFDALRNLKKND